MKWRSGEEKRRDGKGRKEEECVRLIVCERD